MSVFTDLLNAAKAAGYPPTDVSYSDMRAVLAYELEKILATLGTPSAGLKLQPYLGASSLGLVNDLPIGAAATTFGGFVCFNNNATDDRYLQFFDATSAPVNGTAPVFAWPVFHGGGSSSFASYSFGDAGLKLSRGLILVSSSTPATKTLSGADLLIMALYRTT